MADDLRPVTRKTDSLQPLYHGLAHQIQEEFDYWISRERLLRDELEVATEQANIREKLLGRLREVISNS